MGFPRRTPAPRPKTSRVRTYRLRYVCCRQRGCPVCGGVRLDHGPYWFEGASLGARRCAGKSRPPGVTAQAEATLRQRAEAERARKARPRKKAMPRETAVTRDLRRLGLPVGATFAEVKRAFRERALVCHPDRAGGSHEAMQVLNEAYERLQRAFASGG